MESEWSDDEDVPQLSREALLALNEFLAEKSSQNKEVEDIDEDWQLSQFWVSQNLKLIRSDCDSPSLIFGLICHYASTQMRQPRSWQRRLWNTAKADG